MACSKIFLGDLPDLLYKIIQYFRSDFSTLHSCILVNRLWCRLTIPLLWENPFSIISNKNNYSIKYNFIVTYLVKLNDNDKIKLYEFGINNLSTNILFNHPCFIKHLDTRLISICIERWAAAVKKIETLPYTFIRNLPNIESRAAALKKNRTLRNSQNSDFIKFIYKSLIKIFIENEAIIHTFDVSICYKPIDVIPKLILQSSNFVRNIKNLHLRSSSLKINNINPLLKFLSSNCSSISSLFIPSFKGTSSSTAIEYLSQSSQLIKSQKNLSKILFFYDFPYSTLLNSNCLNTLNTIILCNIDFKNMNFLNEVFEQLNVLESIHIIDCRSLDFNFLQQITNLTKPFKLKSLFVNNTFESIELLLQKSGDYLENFGFESFNLFDDEPESQLFELITKYCKKIEFFELCEFNSQNIYPTFNLIKNIQQNLNYLTIDLDYDFGKYFYNNIAKISSNILQNLGQILPPKLEYLNMSLVMNTNDFVIFLKKSQNTFIKKLLFKDDGIQDKTGKDDMLHYTKEYIMRKERVKYFAFRFYTNKWDELYDLEDEVKQFSLHNIVVQNYNDLKIGKFKRILEE
ncbi:uncharacterized protein OCT59_000505 [Rhizophagus irregularis]|uniref:F-box domain-containing protein n=4 Tax=Rhizophagus irregularis TaxID=588596 RepID=A0A2H5TZP9_RHIID|nr:hypothetical protein GLOIN_2v1877443 [Rhizophagus irregularis DAOM 181602=DAOM 197198]POG69555.1 hypothetical protein GLOIN_2v1877443 [Rhizophagus irregularis DAOM 181602=DAOM 197198]UZN99225.1 hypothetical protein OCT59_000505 [Rhizophagus irregularis]|eukprot:XP_025176421.1 hypothetical protein GLOIN_2v1877443 [Rhizophagus irregularis DAOM 181602=DAOM 197198]